MKVVQAGDPVLRATARQLSRDEIADAKVQQLIELMRETMRDAPGVGLAAPQVGVGLSIAVIEDRPEYQRNLHPARKAAMQREPVPFHVIINPTITAIGDEKAEFFEGCLSLKGFSALTRRHLKVKVEALNEKGEAVSIKAEGWYARILQHEIDHLQGTMYVDRMETRSFMNDDNYLRHWAGVSVENVRELLELNERS